MGCSWIVNTVWFAEVKPKWITKISCGEVYPHLFIVSSESPTAQKYNPRVCERYQEEEKELSEDFEECLKWNDNVCIQMNECIQDLELLG